MKIVLLIVFAALVFASAQGALPFSSDGSLTPPAMFVIVPAMFVIVLYMVS